MSQKCPTCNKRPIGDMLLNGQCMSCWRDKWTDETDDLRKALAAMTERCEKAEAERNKAQGAAIQIAVDTAEKIATLRDALRPFSEATKCYGESCEDGDPCDVDGQITVGHLRRAAEAMTTAAPNVRPS